MKTSAGDSDRLWTSDFSGKANETEVTCGSEAIPPFGYYPDSNPRWDAEAKKYTGADVGPLQVGNSDVYAKEPFTTLLSNPMGTFTTVKIRFDGSPQDNLRWGARAYTLDILQRYSDRATAAGVFRWEQNRPGFQMTVWSSSNANRRVMMISSIVLDNKQLVTAIGNGTRKEQPYPYAITRRRYIWKTGRFIQEGAAEEFSDAAEYGSPIMTLYK